LQCQQTLIYEAAMQIITETELLGRIREFLARHEMAPTTFGRKATGNANLIKELEEGKSPSLRTVQKVANFMAEADEHARLREKLDAPRAPDPGTDDEAGVDQLPFGAAPVNPTGASSPTSSPTSGRPTSSAANGSSLSCSAEEKAA
jgi:hypothetical protein